jgi:hypothetical protein
MPTTGTLQELVYDAVKKSLPPYVPESQARLAITALVESLLTKGWRIFPPGAINIDPQEKLKVQGTSVRCPGCGALDPDLGFKGETRGVPQGGKIVQVGIAYIFCAKDTCHTILSVVAQVQMEEGRIQ